ncbi:hypothetical protein AB0N14_23445 [Streptomyces sp. NPDC051104]|uniref:Rv1733c family protein n=1 Tax=Streptomyces sp. NPDC051104 TaxID=3155044 RepID=UPI003429D054
MATTCRTAGTRVWLWRWRRNPLLRRSDRFEAWIVLVTWLLVLLAGVLAGRAAAGAVEHGLAVRAAHSNPVRALLTQDAARTTEDVHAYGNGGVWANVRWSAPGGPHTGLARVEPGLKAGDPVTVWTNDGGNLVSKPATGAETRLQASLVGTIVGCGAAGGVLACGWLVRGRLERQRMEEWDREWECVGPQWR